MGLDVGQIMKLEQIPLQDDLGFTKVLRVFFFF